MHDYSGIKYSSHHRVARENPVQRMEEQQRDLLQYREARSDPEYQAQVPHINSMHTCIDSRCIVAETSVMGISYQPEHFYNTTDIGTLSLQCSNCDVLKNERETASLCCSKGNVQLQEFPQVQPFL